jgi:Ca-activated chloride channel family protein
MNINKYYILSLFFLPWSILAQSEHAILLDGTTAYKKGDFETAENNFRDAVQQNGSSLKGNFNLGNALYKRQKYDEAATSFQNAASNTDNNLEKSKALYNLGNTKLAQAKGGMKKQGQSPATLSEDGQKQLKDAIEAYKGALRSNSKDYDAKNNLGAAYKLMRQQEQQQQQKQQKQDQNKDKNEENKDENKDNKPNEDKPKKEEPIDNDNESSSSETEEMKKDEVDRLMEIIEQEDKKVQEKLMERKRGKTQKPEKDW